MTLYPGPFGESLSRFDHSRKWSDLVKLELLPEVKSIKDYDIRLFSNIIATRDLLTRSPQTLTIPSPDQVRAIHRAVFNDIHPWAGTFRSNTLAIGGRIGADPSTLVANLEIAQEEAQSLRLSEDWGPVQVAVYYHLRFELIHPFRDGNGRVGRLILASHIKNMRGLDMHPPLDARERYLDCMDHAAWCGRLGPLIRLVETWCGEMPTNGDFYSPYKLSPRFLESGESFGTLNEELRRASISPEEWAKRARRSSPLRPSARDTR